jgi:hypothetical protein
VALAVEPAEEDCDRAGVVAEGMAGAEDEAELGGAVGVGYDAGVERGDDLVVAAVDHQKGAGGVAADAGDRPDAAELAGPGVEVRGELGVGDHADLTAVFQQAAGVAGPVVEVAG